MSNQSNAANNTQQLVSTTPVQSAPSTPSSCPGLTLVPGSPAVLYGNNGSGGCSLIGRGYCAFTGLTNTGNSGVNIVVGNCPIPAGYLGTTGHIHAQFYVHHA